MGASSDHQPHALCHKGNGVQWNCLEDHPMGHINGVSGRRWVLVAGSIITLNYRTFCQEYPVFQDRCSFMVVVSQDRCLTVLRKKKSEILIVIFLTCVYSQKRTVMFEIY